MTPSEIIAFVKNWFKNYKITTHSLLVAGGAMGAFWASDAAFRQHVHAALAQAPYWVQSGIAFLTFLWLTYFSPKKGATVTVQPGEEAVGAVGVKKDDSTVETGGTK